jgi:hypothetical protein
MNTEQSIIWFTAMVDRTHEAPPEIVAKLLPHVSTLKKFAEAIAERANELARSDELPGYTKGEGRAKALAWVDDADLPAFLYESKPMSPAQAIKNKLVSEETITKQGWAVRSASEVVAVRLEEVKTVAEPRKVAPPRKVVEPVIPDECPF